MSLLNTRMDAVQSPIIPVVGQLIKENPGTISLGQGVVYYAPPPEALAGISQFLEHPDHHKYQSVSGILPLQEALQIKLVSENKIPLNETNCIIVTAGSNMAFMNAILAITSPGDEIILLIPYYFNHEMAIQMAGCIPILVPTDENYQLDPDAIERAITDKTRAIVTVSPNNPTGVIYPKDALFAVNQICQKKGIYHISDEAYEYFTYHGIAHISPASFPDSHSYTISLFSLSKAYGFASWRIGYMVIPQHLKQAVMKIQDTNLICPPVISQYAALGALNRGKSYCLEHLQNILSVREWSLKELEKIADFCLIPPTHGAFYFLLNVQTSQSAMEIMERLIREYQVAVIPGTTFGISQGCYLRVAYGSLQWDTVTIGMGRLIRGLQQICA